MAATTIETGKRIGPALGDELRAAGITKLAWRETGELLIEEGALTADEQVRALAVVAAHDATRPASATARRAELAAALTELENTASVPAALRTFARLFRELSA